MSKEIEKIKSFNETYQDFNRSTGSMQSGTPYPVIGNNPEEEDDEFKGEEISKEKTEIEEDLEMIETYVNTVREVASKIGGDNVSGYIKNRVKDALNNIKKAHIHIMNQKHNM